MRNKITKAPPLKPEAGVFSFSDVVSVTFSEGVSMMSNNMARMFIGCENLVSVYNIPNNVVNMTGTFRGCTNLTQSPVIPNSVTTMEGTFERCYNLTTPPTLPSNVTSLAYTFQDCTNLTLNGTYQIPELVTNMIGTFMNCVNVTGNFYVISKRINNTSMRGCFNGTSLRKKVMLDPTGYNATANTWNAATNATYGISGKNGVIIGTLGEDHGGGAN